MDGGKVRPGKIRPCDEIYAVVCRKKSYVLLHKFLSCVFFLFFFSSWCFCFVYGPTGVQASLLGGMFLAGNPPRLLHAYDTNQPTF